MIKLLPTTTPMTMSHIDKAEPAPSEATMPPRIRLAASYARKSNKSSDGIATQHDINRKTAARDGYLIPDHFCYFDDDTTGVSTARQGFDRLLALINSGSAPFEALYVRDKKRLGRWDDSGMHDYIRIHCANQGVTLRYSEGANPDYSRGMSPEVAVQSIYDRIETIDASTERTETRWKTITGARRRIVTGFWPGTVAPYATQRWLADLRTGQLLRIVNEGDGIRQRECGYKLAWLMDGSYRAVQLILEWVETERLAPVEIVRRLDELKLPPAVRPGRRSPHSSRVEGKADLRWTTAGVERILGNLLYCGQLLWPRRARIEDAVSHLEADLNAETPILHTAYLPDPPVSVERFEAVQEIIRSGRRRGTPATPAMRPLLSGMLRCSQCDAPWHGHLGIYYRHSNHDHHTGGIDGEHCLHRNRYVRIEAIDSAVLDRVLPALDSEKFVRDLEDQLDAYATTLNGGEVDDEIKNLHHALEDTQKEIRGVIRDRAKTDDPRLLKLHEDVLAQLSEQVTVLEERIGAYEVRKTSLAEAWQYRDRLVASARSMLAVYRQLPMQQRKSILSGLIEAIRLDPELMHATVELKLRP